MNRLRFHLFLFITVLFFTACSIDDDDSLSSPKNQVIQETNIGLRSSKEGEPDQALLQSFYEDILSLQSRTGFYDEFYNLYGYLDWQNSLEFEAGENGKMLSLVVKPDRCSKATGLFLYFLASNNTTKIKFVERGSFSSEIEDRSVGNYTFEERFIYKNFYLSDLRNKCIEDIEDPNFDIIVRDGDEEMDEEAPCEGGAFEWVCTRITGPDANSDWNVQDLIKSILKETYVGWNSRTSDLDGLSIAHMESIINDGSYKYRNGQLLSNAAQQSFLQYYQDRLLLAAFGIGAGADGLWGNGTVVIDMKVECDWVWVWCWQDPADFEITGFTNTPGGGDTNSTTKPPYQDVYDALRLCEGYEEPTDTGADNPESVHPNYDFCKVWMTYLEDCILPNAILSEGYGGGYAHLILQWAQFQYYYGDAFMETIENPSECLGSEEVEENNPTSTISAECLEALNDFEVEYENEYGYTLTLAERKAILNGTKESPCSAGFEKKAKAILAEEYMKINTVAQQASDIFLINYPNDKEAAEHRDLQILMMKNNPEYAEYIEASMGFSGIMWVIAKEVIGDKLVDIIGEALIGGQKQDVLDAIKAAKNGDPLGVIYNAALVVGKSSPLGKAIKAVQISAEMASFIIKINKAWNKIEGYTEFVVEQMWDIVKKYPDDMRINADLIGSVAKLVKNGLKSIDDVMASIPNFTQMSSSRMKHILHGDATGGLHHVSGLVNDPAKKIIDFLPPNTKGVYRIKLESSNEWKTMFPDAKSEIGVAKSIEFVFNNKVSDEIIGNGKRLIKGFDSANIPIEIITDLNYNIISAFPKYIP